MQAMPSNKAWFTGLINIRTADSLNDFGSHLNSKTIFDTTILIIAPKIIPINESAKNDKKVMIIEINITRNIEIICSVTLILFW